MPETLKRKLWSSRVAASSAVFIAALGSMVLLGWFLHIASLIQLRPDLPPMTRNAAACFLLSGLALLTIVLKGSKWIVATCAGIVAAASVLTIGEYLFHVNAGIDELLGPSYVVLRVSSPGRMAPIVALCFALGSIGLLFGPNRLAKHAGLLLGLIGSMIAAAGIATSLAVLLGSSDAPDWGDVTDVALHTAIGLWVFGFGVLALAWKLEADQSGTPRWLPISMALGVATSTLALWQALIADGYAPFAPLPAALLVGGCLMAPILGAAIYQTQRAHTQKEKLQANQDLLDLAQKSARAMAFDWYIQEPVNRWSPEQEALYGLAPGTFDGTYESWKKLVHVDDWPLIVESLKNAQQSGDISAEYRVVWPDGSTHWLAANGQMFLDAEGGPLRMVGFTADVTARKLAEVQLAGEKRLLEMVAAGHALADVLTELCKFVEETAGDCKCGIYLIDWRTGTFRLGAAPSLPPTFNDPVEGLTVTADAGPCGLAALTRAQVIVNDVESDPRFQSATIRPLLLQHGLRSHWSTPIHSGDGRVLGTFAIFRDRPSSPTRIQQDLLLQVTHIASIAMERALSEAALRQSETFLAEAQRLSRIGSFSWRVATDEITWSEELYSIYEFDPGTNITLDVIRTRVHPEDLALYQKMVEQARNGADDFDWQYRLLMPDQSIKYMQAIAQATRDHAGQLEYIAAVQDVTAGRLSEEALDKARSELAHVARIMSLGALTASIAHEVNQPLSGIITNASTCVRMLDAEPPNVDGARETAKRTIRDGRRAADVITRLRALFSRKDAATELVDLNEATREVIALSRTELERNRVITRAELADELPPVTGDRVQLQQVILNLLRNGSDAMSSVDDRPRELWFRTEVEEGDVVRLSVQDAGIGFAPQSLDRLFQTFYTTKDDGMGIGLSVSRSIIENHGGRLSATLNDGPGVTFSFSIPCVVNGSTSNTVS